MFKNYNKIIVFEIGSALFFMGFGALILLYSLLSGKTLSEFSFKERVSESIYDEEQEPGLHQKSILPFDKNRVTLETDITNGKSSAQDSIIQRLDRLQLAMPTERLSRIPADEGRFTKSIDINDLLNDTKDTSIGYKRSKPKVATPHISRGASERDNMRSEDIALVITNHNDAIEHCYKRESNINPNLKGEVSVAFIISYSGRVIKLQIVESTLRNKKVENCITSRIRGWRFQPLDKKEGDVAVTQKYIFN
jgi:TonB family protein